MGAPGQTAHVTSTPTAVRGGTEPGPRIDDMAVDLIRAAALYPTYGLMIQGVTEPEPALALCRAINDWMAEYCAHDPAHLFGVGTLPMADAGDALAEARRCVEELGFRGVWRRPEHLDGTPHLQDESYEPLWDYLEEAGVPLAIHPGLNGVVPVDELRRRFDDYFSAMHAAHFVTEQMLALTTFVAYGILERHPGLRVAFLESGAVWALSYVHRLDEHAEVFGFERAGLKLEPSDYFRRQCFVVGRGGRARARGDARRVSRLGGVRLRLPARRRHLPRLDRRAPREREPGGTNLDNAVERVLLDNSLRLYGLDHLV